MHLGSDPSVIEMTHLDRADKGRGPTISSIRSDTCVVITVTYNSASTIAAFLTSLEAEGDDILRVVVVDNGSSDDTTTVIRQFVRDHPLDVVLIESTNTGFAGGYEVGRKALTSSEAPILCLNPDVVLRRGTVRGLLEAIREIPNVGIATTPLVGLDGVEDNASRRSLPSLASGSLYGVFGRLLPRQWRYNAGTRSSVTPSRLPSGTAYSRVEATTGALMMLSPSFRDGSGSIFDLDYWMYGEDLQLCRDAQRDGRSVVVVEMEPSVHVKGVSSGWPRSPASHRAFHDAMATYYEKNLRKSAAQALLVIGAIHMRFLATSLIAGIARRSTQVRR